MNQVRLHDLSTNQIIDRDMTTEELEIAAALSADSIAEMAAGAEKAEAKAALLERLGITNDEAKLLL